MPVLSVPEVLLQFPFLNENEDQIVKGLESTFWGKEYIQESGSALLKKEDVKRSPRRIGKRVLTWLKVKIG